MLNMLVARYGLIILFLGAGIEGEATVIAGGLLAHEGLLDPWAVVAVASAGSLAADQCLFAVGRHLAQSRRVIALLQRPAAQRVRHALEKRPTIYIFGFRFLLGMRTISPIAIGTTHVATLKFLCVNLVAALVWAGLFTAVGYLFGSSIERMLGHVPWLAKIGLAAGCLVALTLTFKLVRARRHRATSAE